MRLTVNVDGGARGNPGPAAVGVVIRDADGEVIHEVGERIGRATNNEAEYRAMILGIERARELGATELDLRGDSELVVKQIRGEYKVKKADLRPLCEEARAALAELDDYTLEHVRRERNSEADSLVNQALDAG